MLTLKEEVAVHHQTLLAPDRPCEKCRELPASGGSLQFVSVRFAQGTAVFSLCDRCVAGELDHFQMHLMSHEAASVFLCRQEADGLTKLVDELARMSEWIGKHSGPGQLCDECGCPLLGEPISTAAVAITGGMAGYQVLHAVCSRCAKTQTPRLRAKCDQFIARLVSTRATPFIRDLISPNPVVN